MFVGVQPQTARFDADAGGLFFFQEVGEDAHGVGAAADAGDDVVGQPILGFEDLGFGFVADDGLKVAHHHRVGVGPRDGADDVEGVAGVGDPVAYRVVHGVFEGLGAALDGVDLGAQELHPKDVEGLALHVLGTHEDFALQPQQGRDGGGGHAVLPRARFGDDPLFAQPLGDETLQNRVVDLVGPGVVEIFAFEVDGSTDLVGDVFGVVEGAGASDVVLQVVVGFTPKLFVEADFGIGVIELFEDRHQGFRDVTPAEDTEMAQFVGVEFEGFGNVHHSTSNTE